MCTCGKGVTGIIFIILFTYVCIYNFFTSILEFNVASLSTQTVKSWTQYPFVIRQNVWGGAICYLPGVGGKVGKGYCGGCRHVFTSFVGFFFFRIMGKVLVAHFVRPIYKESILVGGAEAWGREGEKKEKANLKTGGRESMWGVVEGICRMEEARRINM